jgi:hypothetical protein
MKLGLGLGLGRGGRSGPQPRELRVKTETNPDAYETYKLADGQVYLVKQEA